MKNTANQYPLNMPYVQASDVHAALRSALAKRAETGEIQVVFVSFPAWSGKTTAVMRALDGLDEGLVVQHDKNQLLMADMDVPLCPDILVADDVPDDFTVRNFLRKISSTPGHRLEVQHPDEKGSRQWNPVVVIVTQLEPGPSCKYHAIHPLGPQAHL